MKREALIAFARTVSSPLPGTPLYDAAIHHLNRVHPGVVEQMKRGEAFAHLGFHEREGV